MARKTKSKTTSDVVGRVATALLECPMTADEIRSLAKIETRRQEAEAEQRYAVTDDQKRKAYAKAAKVGDDAMALMGRVGARRDASWSAAALQEIDVLAKGRGEDLDGEKAGARMRVSPLVRLYRGRLIDEAQYEAGKLYGTTWQRLYGGKTGDGTGRGTLDPLESRIADLMRLDEARGYARENVVDVGGRKIVSTGLGGDARLIKLVDDVCGAEKSLREAIGTSARVRKRAMEQLRRALGLLALHYGILKTRENDLKAA